MNFSDARTCYWRFTIEVLILARLEVENTACNFSMTSLRGNRNFCTILQQFVFKNVAVMKSRTWIPSRGIFRALLSGWRFCQVRWQWRFKYNCYIMNSTQSAPPVEVQRTRTRHFYPWRWQKSPAKRFNWPVALIRALVRQFAVVGRAQKMNWLRDPEDDPIAGTCVQWSRADTIAVWV